MAVVTAIGLLKAETRNDPNAIREAEALYVYLDQTAIELQLDYAIVATDTHSTDLPTSASGSRSRVVLAGKLAYERTGCSPKPSCQRMRRHRERRRDGLRCLIIELRETEIDALIQRSLLNNETRNDPGAIIDALYAFLDDTLDAAP